MLSYEKLHSHNKNPKYLVKKYDNWNGEGEAEGIVVLAKSQPS